jgi:phosphatidylinositol kinase/protein kinase (PI-3  family)
MGLDFFSQRPIFPQLVMATFLQGVEGVFRASCERSLAVLRANKEALLTVLEVMLHDPLYNWSVGPGKAAAKQAGEWKKLCDEDGAQKNKGNRQVVLFTSKFFFHIGNAYIPTFFLYSG